MWPDRVRRRVDAVEADRGRLGSPARLQRRAGPRDRLRGLPPLRLDPPELAVTGRPVVMRVADGVVRRLIGDKLTVEYADGRTTERVVPAEDLPEALAGLDVVLSEEEVDRLRLV
jgi:hypothetical protein